MFDPIKWVRAIFNVTDEGSSNAEPSKKDAAKPIQPTWTSHTSITYRSGSDDHRLPHGPSPVPEADGNSSDESGARVFDESGVSEAGTETAENSNSDNELSSNTGTVEGTEQEPATSSGSESPKTEIEKVIDAIGPRGILVISEVRLAKEYGEARMETQVILDELEARNQTIVFPGDKLHNIARIE